jgi:hypothetical protein
MGRRYYNRLRDHAAFKRGKHVSTRCPLFEASLNCSQLLRKNQQPHLRKRYLAVRAYDTQIINHECPNSLLASLNKPTESNLVESTRTCSSNTERQAEPRAQTETCTRPLAGARQQDAHEVKIVSKALPFSQDECFTFHSDICLPVGLGGLPGSR